MSTGYGRSLFFEEALDFAGEESGAGDYHLAVLSSDVARSGERPLNGLDRFRGESLRVAALDELTWFRALRLGGRVATMRRKTAGGVPIPHRDLVVHQREKKHPAPLRTAGQIAGQCSGSERVMSRVDEKPGSARHPLEPSLPNRGGGTAKHRLPGTSRPTREATSEARTATAKFSD